MTPRLVTGLGIACALGTGSDTFFRGLVDAKRLSALPASAIASFDVSKYPDARIVEVPEFDATKYLGDKGLRTLDRLTKLLVVAARLCLHDAGIKKDNLWVALAPERVGVVCSNAYGSLEAITELDRVAKLEDARYINPAKFPNTVSNSASGYVSIWEDLRALTEAKSLRPVVANKTRNNWCQLLFPPRFSAIGPGVQRGSKRGPEKRRSLWGRG